MPDGFQPLSREELEGDWKGGWTWGPEKMRLTALYYLDRCASAENVVKAARIAATTTASDPRWNRLWEALAAYDETDAE